MYLIRWKQQILRSWREENFEKGYIVYSSRIHPQIVEDQGDEDLVKSGPQRPRKQRSARACPVARACYVCATLGRSTTPTSFLLEHAPMFSPCIRIRARMTYDLLLFEEERKQLHRSSFILHREIGSIMIFVSSKFILFEITLYYDSFRKSHRY